MTPELSGGRTCVVLALPEAPASGRPNVARIKFSSASKEDISAFSAFVEALMDAGVKLVRPPARPRLPTPPQSS